MRFNYVGTGPMDITADVQGRAGSLLLSTQASDEKALASPG